MTFTQTFRPTAASLVANFGTIAAGQVSVVGSASYGDALITANDGKYVKGEFPGTDPGVAGPELAVQIDTSTISADLPITNVRLHIWARQVSDVGGLPTEGSRLYDVTLGSANGTVISVAAGSSEEEITVDFPLNVTTGLPWTKADLAGAYIGFGFISVTGLETYEYRVGELSLDVEVTVPGFPILGVPAQFFDDDGHPVAGGKMASYAAGTTTPLATYNNVDLDPSHANDNPTILDSAGMATFFAADGVAYKFILSDANDVPLWTRDNISVPEIETPPAPAEVPTGGIIMYGAAAAPTGYLLCDGTAVSRTTYADLFGVVGVTFGVGNGSTTFNLPDMRGRFPLGKSAAGTGNTLGATGGTIDHVHTGPSHTHPVSGHTHSITHTHSVSRTGWGGTQVVGPTAAGKLLATDGTVLNLTESQNDVNTGASSDANTGSTSLTTDASGTANTGSANPPFQVFQFVIKT